MLFVLKSRLCDDSLMLFLLNKWDLGWQCYVICVQKIGFVSMTDAVLNRLVCCIHSVNLSDELYCLQVFSFFRKLHQCRCHHFCALNSYCSHHFCGRSDILMNFCLLCIRSVLVIFFGLN
jgi:hypothetical protein